MAEEDPDWPEAARQGRPAAQAGEAMPQLNVAGFEGLLDFLLEMIRRHRVDLGPLSIVAMTDQVVVALEAGADRVPLARRSSWLVAASDVVLLKAKLLCPEIHAVAEAAAAEATQRLGQLAELACMRTAADWLAARSQLGLQVFARGADGAAGKVTGRVLSRLPRGNAGHARGPEWTTGPSAVLPAGVARPLAGARCSRRSETDPGAV